MPEYYCSESSSTDTTQSWFRNLCSPLLWKQEIKKLVDHLHALGYSVCYDEVWRFLISAALDQKEGDLFVPRGTESGGDHVMVDAAIDNFDQNEQTLVGKSTTHAMAAVLYKRCPIDASKWHIKQAKEKSLAATDALAIDVNIQR